MNFDAVRLPRACLGLRLKRFAFRVLRSSFWQAAFNIQFTEKQATRIAGLKPRLDTLRAIALLLGAEIIEQSMNTEREYLFYILWVLEYKGDLYHADNELEVIEWFLSHEGLHPDDPCTRGTLHGDGHALWR